MIYRRCNYRGSDNPQVSRMTFNQEIPHQQVGVFLRLAGRDVAEIETRRGNSISSRQFIGWISSTCTSCKGGMRAHYIYEQLH